MLNRLRLPSLSSDMALRVLRVSAPSNPLHALHFFKWLQSSHNPHFAPLLYLNQVCWPPVNGGECFDADILAAFVAAIADGVHVLSVSLGREPGDYFKDGIAIRSFHAVNNGMRVVCSAGNSGTTAGSVSNLAPWIFTVAASTMDRELATQA